MDDGTIHSHTADQFVHRGLDLRGKLRAGAEVAAFDSVKDEARRKLVESARQFHCFGHAEGVSRVVEKT